uniref:Uncharacterized protein n=1 Tax=Cairina moschata TaxID=8855 RepID=A0A8C3CLK0_CAIMO
MTLPTETSNQHFIVFLTAHLNEVQATIVRNEGCDFFAILDQLDSYAFPDGRHAGPGSPPERHPHFLQDDALGVRGAAEGVGLQRRAQVRLLVLLVVPLLVAAVAAQLPGGAEPAALPCGTTPGGAQGGGGAAPLPAPRHAEWRRRRRSSAALSRLRARGAAQGEPCRLPPSPPGRRCRLPPAPPAPRGLLGPRRAHPSCPRRCRAQKEAVASRRADYTRLSGPRGLPRAAPDCGMAAAARQRWGSRVWGPSGGERRAAPAWRRRVMAA